MKLNSYYLLLIALCGMMTLQSCDNDDNPLAVTATTRTAFENRYPDATHAEWELKAGYHVAEFWENGKEKEAWFTPSGDWCMTETDFGVALSQLPSEVQATFGNSVYGNWHIEDIDFYERPDKTFYLIEVEAKGEKDHKLFYSPQGVLLKEAVDKNNDEVRPDTVI